MMEEEEEEAVKEEDKDRGHINIKFYFISN